MRWEREIFVFGSNEEGRHGKGMALEAIAKHGAIYGQARGLQGNAYAIVTKDLQAPRHPSILRWRIELEVHAFLWFARCHPRWKFVVTPIGCGLAGFEVDDIAPMFAGAPRNVVLPDVFKSWLEEYGDA